MAYHLKWGVLPEWFSLMAEVWSRKSGNAKLFVNPYIEFYL